MNNISYVHSWVVNLSCSKKTNNLEQVDFVASCLCCAKIKTQKKPTEEICIPNQVDSEKEVIIVGGYTTTPDTTMQILSNLPQNPQPKTKNSMKEDEACNVTIPVVPGHGDQVPENISPEEIKKFIDEQATKLIKLLQNDKQIKLIGHSMGGALILQIIAETYKKIHDIPITDENNNSLINRLNNVEVTLLSPKFEKDRSIPLFLAEHCPDCGINLLLKKHTDTPPTEGQPYMTQKGISQAVKIGNEGLKSYETILKKTQCKIEVVLIVNDPLIKSDVLVDQLIDGIPDDQINQDSKTNLKNQLKKAIEEFKQNPTMNEDKLKNELNTIIKEHIPRLSFKVMARDTDHNPLRILAEKKDTQEKYNGQLWSDLLSRK